MNTNLLIKTEKYVEELLSSRCPQHYRYHNFLHIKSVVNAAITISENEMINEHDKEIIILACLFHDIGYLDICDGHEARSCEYARKFLLKEAYPESDIEKIESCILATKIPQQPKNKLEMIVCDADLHHLGSVDFLEVGNNLRFEIELIHKINFTDETWLEKTISFNRSHSYFTDYAKKVYGQRKEANVSYLEMLLANERIKKKFTS